jgi:DNA adenine methylase
MLSWVGGKSLLADKIIPMIPTHRCYVEVFAGAAWLLFKKPESKAEVINDINRDLVTLYRVVQNHLEEFARYFKWMLISRDEFERLRKVDPSTLTDIQRSARFYYLIKAGFGSRAVNPTFGISTTQRLRLGEELSEAHLRLARVTVENLPYADVIKRYDRPATFFYVDPPYFKCEDYYGKGLFSRADFANLAELLGGIKGKFIMSINDAPEIRKAFAGFKITTAPTRYSLASKKVDGRVVELLVANF